MKKSIFLLMLLATGFMAQAQSTYETFNVGPYKVEYYGDGDYQYRLADDVDLYEYFELQTDTTVVVNREINSLESAFQIAGKMGANRFAAKEIGIEGAYKRQIGENLYFNGGLSLVFGLADYGSRGVRRSMMEIGLPLQVELGNLSHDAASLYGSAGLQPAFYSTMKSTVWDGEYRVETEKNSGFLLTPMLEFGVNIPVSDIIMRVGFYGEYKINCTPGDYNMYTTGAGCAFLGAKLGIVF